MPKSAKRRLITAFMTAGVVGGMVLSPSAYADPDVPPAPVEPAAPAPAPDPFALPAPADPLAPAVAAPASPGPSVITNYGSPTVPFEGTAPGQNSTPFTGEAPFLPPSFNPVNGSMVGVAKPIYINFQRPIANRQMAQDAIRITSNPPVAGRFYWVTDTQLRWRPQDFWPSNTVVNIDAAGTRSSFRVGDYLVATVDDKSHQMEILRNGKLEKTFPVSMGKPDGKHETKNGTYYVLEKFPDIIMDSSTYGVPVDSKEGYKLKVQDAVRIDNSGVFVHSAPWSVAQQGKSNSSHGCINLSPENAQWFYDNFGSGDPVVIKNTGGGWYNTPDGASDWQMF
ncbi:MULTISPECIES: L,D-transpeptidase family protein [unclassified Mycolicibacterium]|uniref:L,D-transpeptidase n=1 Tax=unclassified Mycolicibacterium TaxID=2636767 RepID=UPI0012DE35E3|nr:MULTISPECIES: L,D-transpeptidase [unclassified Mycolicibacterium]MUL82731.1 L,D-transpeptidase [Mycolicibacterium sp. CBMA 329]MUL89066.1 L,D-transpeptidase [Mycolicibacterium sp. CBMA 331]MUL97633.1 L,D-transpeptidase [Mycolicibacterium sp. CBMA 334]MUM30199.1 L,D-transpeptidase [Mycolicibacterium sp. CBMA 295]MUM38582.1 L,D-transpeptidase [Mycolicibacterium sp. CBMA 247]